MFAIRLSIQFLCVSILVFGWHSLHACAEPLAIMPFGDSITNGYHGSAADRGSYRHFLADQFALMEWDVDFVGDYNVGRDGLIDGNVQARGGYRIEQMTHEFVPSVSTHRPDIVLMLAGTNNHWDDPIFQEFVDRYEHLAESLQLQAPESQFIVSTVPQFACCRADKVYWSPEFVEDRNNVRIPNMNSAIRAVADQLTEFSVVDLYEEIDPDTDIITNPADHVHLNMSGQAKLGRLFLGEIVKLERGLSSADHIDSFARSIRDPESRPESLVYDSIDAVEGLTDSDHFYLVETLIGTSVGDANLDGAFSSDDLVQVMEHGRYESSDDAGWASGDWNGDGVFSSRDLLTALQRGRYEAIPGGRPPVSVPEPGSLVILATFFFYVALFRSRGVVKLF